ncbi:2'-5'-oligoadenylate synthase 2 [Tenrec ecaudatus]|uniref:2'-5'-oligoadenylate synthase 2 n=1 Tax=Tenrec ecaudatus TaxID=94439 RepID=UPI003F5922A9
MWGWCSYLKVNSIPTEDLGPFIQRSLRPREDSRILIDRAVNAICAVLLNSPHVQGVAKGGSYGRDTVLSHTSDGTLIIFLADLRQFWDHTTCRRDILRNIWERLKASKHLRELAVQPFTTWSPGRLSIQLDARELSIVFEVLSTFRAVGPGEKPSAQLYRELKSFIDTTLFRPGDFSVCFMTLQEEFFKNRPRKLKDLILLVKYWYQQCREELQDSGKLPDYALELLTVYAWEQGCGLDDFDLAEGIRTVLWLITQHRKLCVYWTINYNFENETLRNILLHQLRAPRPVILDPVNPMHNVSGGPDMCWEWLDKEARIWLSFLRLGDGSPGPSWNVLPAPLYITPENLLDKFIQDFLQPSKEFLDQVKKAVDIICSFLKEKCFQTSEDQIKIQKIVKGGSTAKGTALRSGSDADLILFPNNLKSFPSQKDQRSDIIKEVHKQLEACQKKEKFEVKVEISKHTAPRGLSFSLRSKELPESVEFDLLPAFNALGVWTSGSTPSPTVYAELIRLFTSSEYVKGEFSCCFTELQRDFIISRPTKVKSLIRLVKHWYKQCERKLKTKGSLPPKYALELLTIYAWEQGSGEVDFKTAQGFRTVLELVTQYQHLCIFWTVNYNFQDPTVGNFLWHQIQNTRPVILDPAEPTGDVGGGHRWRWDLLAQEAKEWLSSSLCFKDGAGSPVTPWRVLLVQTPGSCGARIQPIAQSHPGAIMSWASTARRNF